MRLVPFIGWGVYIMGLIEDSQRQMGLQTDGLGTLLAALPFQFYPLLALLSIPVFAWLGRDFGPMGRTRSRPPEAPDSDGTTASPWAVVLPLAAVFLTLAALFTHYWLEAGLLKGDKVRVSLVVAYLAGALVSAGMARQALSAATRGFTEGMKRMLPIVVILVLAWSLGEVCSLLKTSAFLASWIGPALPMAALPAVIFVTGAAMSLATGTSYGTFAILMPLAIPPGGGPRGTRPPGRRCSVEWRDSGRPRFPHLGHHGAVVDGGGVRARSPRQDPVALRRHHRHRRIGRLRGRRHERPRRKYRRGRRVPGGDAVGRDPLPSKGAGVTRTA